MTTSTTVGSGLGLSVGSAPEAAWGTWVTPTKWLEPDNESVEWKPTRIMGKGLAMGNLVERDAWRVQPSSTVEGAISTVFYNKGMGQYIGSLMGSLGTSGSPGTGAPVQVSTSTAYLQTHALQDTRASSLSLQIARPSMDGARHRYNYAGVKVEQAKFECGVDELLMAEFTVDGKSQDLSVGALADPTYQTANFPYAFHQMNFKMGTFGSESTVEGIRKWTMTIKRSLYKNAFYADGSNGLKSEQMVNGFTTITLDLETDFLDDTIQALFRADTVQSSVVTFTGPVIAGPNSNFVSFAVPALRWVSEPPKTAGPDVLKPKMQLMATYDSSHAPVSVSIQSIETTL